MSDLDFDFDDEYDYADSGDGDYETERTKCLKCDGTGKIPLFVTLSKCPACQGCGEIVKITSQNSDYEYYD